MNSLDLYMNYLHSIEYRDSKDLIEMYERELMEKYNIKIKTKEGTYEYEKEDLADLDLLIMKHPNYESLEATQDKPKVKVKKNVRPIQKRS